MRQTVEPVYESLFHLRRQLRPRNRRTRGFLDAAPLADVVLLLLFFFISQSGFVLQPGIHVRLPVSEFADGAPYSGLVVTISQEGLVFFNDERTTLEGLASAFERSAHERANATLLIEADGRVRHESLIRIYNMARSAGILDVVLAHRLPPARPQPPTGP